MNPKTVQTKVVSFRYLADFKNWIRENREADITDIKASGGFEDLQILVFYRLME